mgnify:CR=1 FL=1
MRTIIQNGTVVTESAVFAADVLVENGAPLLGTWQGIYFCEFDGPRTRTFYVKVL